MKTRVFIFLLLTHLITTVNGQYHEIDSLERKLHLSSDTSKVKILNRLSGLYQYIDIDKSIALASEALQLTKQMRFQKGAYHATGRLSSLYFEKNQLHDAITAGKEKIALAKSMGDFKLIAKSHYDLGNIFLLAEYISKATEQFILAHRSVEKVDDKFLTGWILNGLGNTCQLSGNYTQASKYFHEALEIFKSCKSDEACLKVIINMGDILSITSDYDKSLLKYFDALKISEKSDDRSTAYILLKMADVYANLKAYDKAIDYYQRSLQYYNRVIHEGNVRLKYSKANCLSGLALVLIQKQNYVNAMSVLEESLEIIKGSDYFPGMVRVYKALTELKEKSGDYQRAFEYKTKHLAFLDSLDSRRQIQKVTEMQVTFQMKENELKIFQLSTDKENNTLFIRSLLVFSFISITLLAIFVVKIRQRTSMRLKTAINDSKVYQEQLVNRENTEKQLRQDLELKSKELTTFTLHLMQKNELLEEVKKEVEELRKLPGDDLQKRLCRLLSGINLSHRVDKEWGNFKLYFDQIHQGFFNNLVATYPGLNAKDLKLCALLRLNLDTKQIAAILDISPDSAKVARHRIRKKIQLSGDENLQTFLNSL